MKKLLLALAFSLGLMGCVEERVYGPPPGMYVTGTVEFCDDVGCRWVTAPYYYEDNEIIYWDAHFGMWIGPHGYWHGGYWHEGFVYGYHDWYHNGWYHYRPSYYYNPYFYREHHHNYSAPRGHYHR